MAPVLSTVPLRSVEERDALVLEWMPYATAVANRISKALPLVVTRDEVRAESYLVLVKAIRDWDGRLNIRSYIYRRVHWGIQDYLRGLDMLPRLVRASLKKSGQDHQTVVHISDTQAESWYAYSGPSPFTLAMRAEVAVLLARVDLTKRQSQVIQQYYFEDKTGVEIAATLGISLQAVWQHKLAALIRLRKYVAPHDTLTTPSLPVN